MKPTRRQLITAGAAALILRGRSARGGPPPAAVDEGGAIAALRAAQLEGSSTAAGVLADHLERGEAVEPRVHALIDLNPDAVGQAEALDARRPRRAGKVAALHGVPVVLKANIATADPVSTCAGSLALEGVRAAGDSPVARRLREAGAVLLATANLSEWANFRSTRSSSGWSARGGQCRNPHVLDRSPCGSSSGSAAAVAAGMAVAAIGTETDGSIVCPAALCGVVGMKPGTGRVSAEGILPIAPSQDVPGPIARSVRDAATVLEVLLAEPEDLTSGLSDDALRGARLGVYRLQTVGKHPGVDRCFDDALAALQEAGAELVDVDGPAWPDALSEAEMEVLVGEFASSVAAYLRRWAPGASVRTLADVVAFNEAHADMELKWFGQELLERAVAHPGPDAPSVIEARATCRRLAWDEGLRRMLGDPAVDAIVCPTVAGPAWPIDRVSGDRFPGGCSGWAAVAGTPHLTVPMGTVHHLPVGLSLFGAPRSEARLLALGHAFERSTRARATPQLRPSLL